MRDADPARLERLRAAAARARPWLLPVAVVAFVVTAVLAVRALPDGLELRWWPIVVSALLVSPLSTAANAAEFAATARVLGRRVRGREALEVAVLSSAANLLPLPGAVAVRTHRLREAAGYRKAFGVTAGAGVCWLGTALAAAGIADLVVHQRVGAAVPIAAGTVALVAAAITVRRSTAADDPGARRAWWWVWAAEVGQVAVGTARLALAVAAIGSPVTVAQGLGLAVAPVAASAVGILPGGLGLREAIAASIAALVELPAAVGGTAAALDRLLGLVVVALLSASLTSRRDTTWEGSHP